MEKERFLEKCIRPVTLPMVSQNGTPPMAMPMQVPHGHMMQQIVDENGTLRHVILSTQPPQPLRQGNVQHHLHPSAFPIHARWRLRGVWSNGIADLLLICGTFTKLLGPADRSVAEQTAHMERGMTFGIGRVPNMFRHRCVKGMGLQNSNRGAPFCTNRVGYT
uniref:Uncharacterized protein n=1 Tax=Anopheles epiroticus TaxID=199890 RepID=A0A182P943_9DIPT